MSTTEEREILIHIRIPESSIEKLRVKHLNWKKKESLTKHPFNNFLSKQLVEKSNE